MKNLLNFIMNGFLPVMIICIAISIYVGYQYGKAEGRKTALQYYTIGSGSKVFYKEAIEACEFKVSKREGANEIYAPNFIINSENKDTVYASKFILTTEITTIP